MSTWKATTLTYFDEDSFNLDNLRLELNKIGVDFEQIAIIDSGEFAAFNNMFYDALDGLYCTAQLSFTKGCMYMRNGDPGYPDESEIDDLTIDKVSILGKKLDIIDSLTDKALSDLEVQLWEESKDY